MLSGLASYLYSCICLAGVGYRVTARMGQCGLYLLTVWAVAPLVVNTTIAAALHL